MRPGYLKLVRNHPAKEGTPAERLELSQEPLLPISNPTLTICTADGLDEQLIKTLVENTRPRLILDFRTTPRFDFGSLNRAAALSLFDSIGAIYRDVGRTLSKTIDSQRFVADALSQISLPVGALAKNDSVLVLIDAGIDFERAGVSAIKTFRERTGVEWELLLFGRTTSDSEQRRIIFISHANPEDNEFAFWLQAQLTRAGYEAWSDITDLNGGQLFWDTIEQVIRNKAARVVAVVSRKSMMKPNVLDEISLAVSVERTRQISSFVVPVRIDDLPFHEVRANIARKNILDFSAGWAQGFSKLADTLRREQVPKARHNDGLSLSDWWLRQKPETLSVTEIPERLISNRFRVHVLPSRVYAYSGTPHFDMTRRVGIARLAGYWLSFASPPELDRLSIGGLDWHSAISTPDLFAGRASVCNGESMASLRRVKHALLNAYWETHLSSLGLKKYEQTGLRAIPFIPDGLLPNNTAYFVNDFGKQSKRILVGYSTRRNVFWHVAPLGYFSTSPDGTLLSLKIRILFSEDGLERFVSADRARMLRRSFCKSWWNDRWRSLQTAFMSWVSNGGSEVTVHDGDAGKLVVQTDPIAYVSPVSIREAYTQTNETDESDQDDLLDDDTQYADEDFMLEPAPHSEDGARP